MRGVCGGTCNKQKGWVEETQSAESNVQRSLGRGAREYSTDTAHNLVEKGLVQEIMRAAINVRQGQGKMLLQRAVQGCV